MKTGTDITRLTTSMPRSTVAKLLGLSRNTVSARLKRPEAPLGPPPSPGMDPTPSTLPGPWASVATRFVRTSARLGPSGLGHLTIDTGIRDVVHALHITGTWNF
ncbi:hypothetical protein [Streptomyces sp. NBC_00893]|uniref:hypothetical protein n=1 Tax=Streptomyces sp. NBC_00893 TaxID=2975862 RepID=UPI002256216D|nr:hypothetical protein [Streptomyces sp. NBC_00893]MCX4851297.1 hypothetical protein [Streptomyces sp. NBC_00893]